MPTENKQAYRKPTGLSQGWNLIRKHDGFVIGHQSAAYPPDAKAIERAERDGYVWVPFLVPAAHPQGEQVAKAKPVAKLHAERLTGRDGEYGVTVEDSAWFNTCRLTGGIFNLYAEQPAPVAVVPDSYCIMPCQLTTENGAKALLLGEFKLQVTMECPECRELEEPTEGCSICDGEGEYGQKHTIPWDLIKYIYSKAVSGLAVKTKSAKS